VLKPPILLVSSNIDLATSTDFLAKSCKPPLPKTNFSNSAFNAVVFFNIY